MKTIKLKSRANKTVTFDATDELSNLNKNDTVANRSDKKRARLFLLINLKTMEIGPITQFMEVEQKQVNYPSFPLSQVTEDL